MTTKLTAVHKQFHKAVGRLDEVLGKEKNDIFRDSAIQRFEFTFDLSWKVVKAYLEEYKGLQCRSPKDCFKEAFRTGVIDYDDTWMQVADWRNTAVHTYDEKFVDVLYGRLPKVLELFKVLEQKTEQ